MRLGKLMKLLVEQFQLSLLDLQLLNQEQQAMNLRGLQDHLSVKALKCLHLGIDLLFHLAMLLIQHVKR